jgi:HSP20 family molecular chaperone IbpA
MKSINMKSVMIILSCGLLFLGVSMNQAKALQFWKKKESPANPNDVNDKGSSANNNNNNNQGEDDTSVLVITNDLFDVFDPFYHSSLWDYMPSRYHRRHRNHHRHPIQHELSHFLHRPSLFDWFDDYDLISTSVWDTVADHNHGSSSSASSLLKPYASLFTTDLVELDQEYRLQIDIPGIDTKDINISLDDNKRKGHATLTIAAERKKVIEEQEKLPEAVEPTKEVNTTISTDGQATVNTEAEKQNAKSNENNKWIKQERIYGKMERQIPLPDNVDLEKVKSQYANGVLTITLPKLPASTIAAQKRQISIEEL